MQHSATHPSDSAERPQGVAPPLARELSWAALLLAWAAAFSDAIGFLVLQQLGASFRHLLLLSGVWGSYIVGAICGSALELHMALFALVFPPVRSRRAYCH